MTQERVSSFVGDLVEMAKAFEQLPSVQAKLADAEHQNEVLSEMIQHREISIIDLKQQIEGHLASIRALEVARDDAELRFLEVEDRANHATLALRSIQTSLGQAIGVIDPPKPEPVQSIGEAVQSIEEVRPEAEKEANWAAMQAQPVEASPYPFHDASISTGNQSWAGGVAENPSLSDPVYPAPQGQSEARPMQAEPILQNSTMDTIARAETNSTNVSPTDPIVSTERKGLFTGLRYYDYPSYVHHDDWINNGGTEEDYLWRPGRVGEA